MRKGLKIKQKKKVAMKSLNSVPSGRDRLDRNMEKVKPTKMCEKKEEMKQIYLLWTLKSKL